MNYTHYSLIVPHAFLNAINASFQLLYVALLTKVDSPLFRFTLFLDNTKDDKTPHHSLHYVV